MIKRVDLSDISTIDINEGNINKIEQIFLRNWRETVFVIDSDRFVHGIITVEDFFRKAASPKNISELMNKNYVSIEANSAPPPLSLSLLAEEIFINKKNIRAIPVVDNGRLICVLINDKLVNNNSGLSFDNIFERTLRLRNDGEKLSEFLKLSGIEKIGVIADDGILSFAGGILSKFVSVQKFNSYDELSQNKIFDFDFVLIKRIDSEVNKIKFNIVVFSLFLDFFDELDKNLNRIAKLSKITDIIIFFIPAVNRINNMTDYELEILQGKIPNGVISNGLNIEIERNDYEKNCKLLPKSIYRNNEQYLCSIESKFVNTIGGRRITTNDKGNYKNKLFVLGNSVVYGYGNEDRHTIPSFMQKMINSTGKYKVINCGVKSHLSLYNVVESATKGDRIIIVLGYYYAEWMWLLKMLENHINPIQTYCLKYLFDRPHDMGEVYWDAAHINHIGNKRVAEEIIKIMDENPQVGLVNRNGIEVLDRKEPDLDLMEKGLRDFLDDISKYKLDTENIGAIVMNCNPFTNGHRYLIEYAANQCEHLFIFVVEEDKSYFKFEDRLNLVKAGTADLSNVTVLPSGKFIISTVTFEEYFDKDNLSGATINPAMDIEIFGKHIAPALNISKRFAGKEPNCYITKQYNTTMREILPRYGVEFVEISRKESEGNPISASMVRKLIEEKDWEAVKLLVPQTTYDYLRERAKK